MLLVNVCIIKVRIKDAIDHCKVIELLSETYPHTKEADLTVLNTYIIIL